MLYGEYNYNLISHKISKHFVISNYKLKLVYTLMLQFHTKFQYIVFNNILFLTEVHSFCLFLFLFLFYWWKNHKNMKYEIHINLTCCLCLCGLGGMCTWMCEWVCVSASLEASCHLVCVLRRHRTTCHVAGWEGPRTWTPPVKSEPKQVRAPRSLWAQFGASTAPRQLGTPLCQGVHWFTTCPVKENK